MSERAVCEKAVNRGQTTVVCVCVRVRVSETLQKTGRVCAFVFV